MAAPKPDKFIYDKDSGYAELATQFRGKGASVFVGWLQSSGVYKPKVVDEKRKSHGPPAPPKNPITVAQIAAIHEFGSSDGKIPQRSMLGATIDEKDMALRLLVGRLLAKVADGEMKQNQALGILGQQVVDWVRSRMVKGIKPALSAATIRRKGAGKSTPLIDTGQLLGSVSFEVRKGKK